MIIINKNKWLINIGIVLTFLIIIIYISRPLLFRKSYINKIVNFNVPYSAKIIDYKFGINSYGIEPFYAKLKISQEDYYNLTNSFLDISYGQNYYYIINDIKDDYIYKSLNIDNVVEVKWNEKMTSKMAIDFGATTRIIHSIITIEDSNIYYLYIFY